MNNALLPFDQFEKLRELRCIKERYLGDHVNAKAAVHRLLTDLKSIKYIFKHTIGKRYVGRINFTAVSGRVKTYKSVLRKLYKICWNLEYKSDELTETVLKKCYYEIKDLAGCRFSCAYIDQVELAVDHIIRQELHRINTDYETHLDGTNYEDKNYLEHGDEKGYRAYHLYVNVPIYDVFGDSKKILCEIQGRSELQHVWADKSHDLLYKKDEGWIPKSTHQEKLMKAISDSIKAADSSIQLVRNSVRGVEDKNTEVRVLRQKWK